VSGGFGATGEYLSFTDFFCKRRVFVSYHHANDRGFYEAFSGYYSNKGYDAIADRSPAMRYQKR
jgi:hypothetical protein